MMHTLRRLLSVAVLATFCAANSLSGSGGFLVYPAAVLTTSVPALGFASLSVLGLALFVAGHRILKHQA